MLSSTVLLGLIASFSPYCGPGKVLVWSPSVPAQPAVEGAHVSLGGAFEEIVVDSCVVGDNRGRASLQPFPPFNSFPGGVSGW